MTPQVGKIYLEPKSLMVVEALETTLTNPAQMFRGQVVSPGRLAEFNPVGQVLPTLDPEAFQLVGESREQFLNDFRHHVVQTNPITTEAALATFGGVE